MQITQEIKKARTFQESVAETSKVCDRLLKEEGDAVEEDYMDYLNQALATRNLLRDYWESNLTAQKIGCEDDWLRVRNMGQLGLIAYRLRELSFTYSEIDIKEISEECDEVLIDKQRDYGPQNILEFGEVGILVRSSDKIERLLNLLTGGREPRNEDVEDTWIDLRNYAQITLMLRREQFVLPLEEMITKNP